VVTLARVGALALPLFAALALSPPALAGEVECSTSSAHPVCKATFESHPAGKLRSNQVSAGTAVVGGATVNYSCSPGGLGAQNAPRKCRW